MDNCICFRFAILSFKTNQHFLEKLITIVVTFVYDTTFNPFAWKRDLLKVDVIFVDRVELLPFEINWIETFCIIQGSMRWDIWMHTNKQVPNLHHFFGISSWTLFLVRSLEGRGSLTLSMPVFGDGQTYTRTNSNIWNSVSTPLIWNAIVCAWMPTTTKE